MKWVYSEECTIKFVKEKGVINLTIRGEECVQNIPLTDEQLTVLQDELDRLRDE